MLGEYMKSGESGSILRITNAFATAATCAEKDTNNCKRKKLLTICKRRNVLCTIFTSRVWTNKSVKKHT